MFISKFDPFINIKVQSGPPVGRDFVSFQHQNCSDKAKGLHKPLQPMVVEKAVQFCSLQYFLFFIHYFLHFKCY